MDYDLQKASNRAALTNGSSSSEVSVLRFQLLLLRYEEVMVDEGM